MIADRATTEAAALGRGLSRVAGRIVRNAPRAAPPLALVATWILTTTVGPTPTAEPDVALYAVYAGDIAGGQLPYRDFLFEYPPLALVPILAADLLGSGPRGFHTAFELLMLGSLLVIQWQAARLAGARGTAVAWSLVLLPPLAGAISAERLDLFAVAFVVAGLVALTSGGRAGLGMTLLGLGTATKLFPAVVAAVAVAWLWGQGRRREAVHGAVRYALVVIAVFLPFALVAQGGFFEQFTFHSQRPVQIESTPAVVLRLLGDGVVTGVEEAPNAFRSQALEGGSTAAVSGVFATLQLAAILLAGLWAHGAGRRSARWEGLLVPAAAAVLAFVALGKVLSPQFVLWLAPLAPLLWLYGARVAAALLVTALVLTQVEFPHRYTSVVEGDPSGVALLLARNGALVVALVLLLAQVARMGRPRD